MSTYTHKTAEAFIQKEAKKYGLRGVLYGVTRSKRVLGQASAKLSLASQYPQLKVLCTFTKLEWVPVVEMSQTHLEKQTDAQVEDTMLHEIAHLLVYLKYGLRTRVAPHGAEWKVIAMMVGATPKASVNFNNPSEPNFTAEPYALISASGKAWPTDRKPSGDLSYTYIKGSKAATIGKLIGLPAKEAAALFAKKEEDPKAFKAAFEEHFIRQHNVKMSTVKALTGAVHAAKRKFDIEKASERTPLITRTKQAPKKRKPGAVAAVHAICKANWGKPRSEIIALCLEAGLNKNTVNRQYSEFKKKLS